MNGTIDERIVNLLKMQIKNGAFKTKEDLIKDPMFVDFINNVMQNDNQGIRDVKTEILNYYDELYKTKETMNLDNLEDIQNSNGNNFIKYVNNDNEMVVLENSIGNKDAKDIIIDKQNELVAGGDKTITETDLVVEDVKKEKIEVEFINDVNPENLNDEQKKAYNAIEASNVLEDSKINYDPVNNIFVDDKTKDTFTVNENKEGNYEITKAEMTDDVKTGEISKTVVEEVKNEDVLDKEIEAKPVLAEASEPAKVEGEVAVSEINKYEQYSEADLRWALDNGRDKFPQEELLKMQAAYDVKASQNKSKAPQLEQPKVLTLKKEYTGFSSLLFLSLVCGIGAISIMMYILLMVGI